MKAFNKKDVALFYFILLIKYLVEFETDINMAIKYDDTPLFKIC